MNASDRKVVILASLLGVVGGAIGAVGATVTQFVSSSVSEDMTRFPFTSGVFVLTEMLWTVAHVLALVGIVGFQRSGLAGSSPMARAGLRIAMVGMALMIPLELGFVFATDSQVDDTLPATLSTLFGPAIILVALGMILAGVATLRSGRWDGWRHVVPLGCGAYTFVFIPLVFTDLALLGIAGFFLVFLILSYAVFSHPEPRPSVTDATSLAASQYYNRVQTLCSLGE